MEPQDDKEDVALEDDLVAIINRPSIEFQTARPEFDGEPYFYGLG